MTEKDKLRRVKNLMYSHPRYWANSSDRKIILDLYEQYKNDLYKSKQWWSRILELVELYKLTDEMKLTDDEIETIWWKISCDHTNSKAEYSKKPQKEGRDNKGVYVGSGGSNCNMIRYPSKKRSIKTWKKFYNLFPWAAIQDGFNGKTSSKMK